MGTGEVINVSQILRFPEAKSWVRAGSENLGLIYFDSLVEGGVNTQRAFGPVMLFVDRAEGQIAMAHLGFRYKYECVSAKPDDQVERLSRVYLDQFGLLGISDVDLPGFVNVGADNATNARRFIGQMNDCISLQTAKHRDQGRLEMAMDARLRSAQALVGVDNLPDMVCQIRDGVLLDRSMPREV